MKFDNQLRIAGGIITDFRGEEPLHVWLKDFFRQNKQMGSRDRKTVAGLVYGFYRLGHAAREMPVKERILLGLFLTTDRPTEFLDYFRPEWSQQASLHMEQKISLVEGFDPAEIFPWKNELSVTTTARMGLVSRVCASSEFRPIAETAAGSVRSSSLSRDRRPANGRFFRRWL